MSACCGSDAMSDSASELERGASVGSFRDWMIFGGLAMIAGVTMIVTLAINLDEPVGGVRTVVHTLLGAITLAAMVFVGAPMVRRAAQRLITLETLFLIGIIGAFTASAYSSVTRIGHVYYDVVLVLLAIYRLGQIIKRHQVTKLNDLSKSIPGMHGKARLKRGDEIIEISIAELKKDDCVVVEPGEMIPVDGKVRSGRAFVEELPHTGEPFPVPKVEGAALIAGTRVLDGSLEIVADVDGDKREIDRLHTSLSETKPTACEALAQRILNGFVPAVITISLLTFLGWGLIGGSWREAIFHGLAVTIVACPCGLGIAIPLAARRGLFQLCWLGLTPRDPDLIARLAKADTLVFDKTGTLSHEEIGLEKLEILPGTTNDLGAWLTTIQRHSTHPVARPFWELAEPVELENLEIIVLPARGIAATFQVGEVRQNLVIEGLQVAKTACCGNSVTPVPKRALRITLNRKEVAIAHLSETPREKVAEILTGLSGRHYRIEIMTGDSSVPRELADLATATHTSMSSAEKADLTKRLQEEGRRVLFVGDGLNDSEALLAADSSIALSSGSSVSLQVAHGVLQAAHFPELPQILTVAKSIDQQLNRILSFVLIYNAAGILLAASGFLHPIFAALLMLGSSATVLQMSAKSYEDENGFQGRTSGENH